MGDGIEIYKEIANMEGVEEYQYSYNTQSKLDINKYGTDYGKKQVEEYSKYSKENNENAEYQNSISVVLLNNEYFKKYIKDLGIYEEDYKNIAILGDDTMYYEEDGSRTVEWYYDIKAKDIIPLEIDNHKIDVKIVKKTDKRPMGYENTYCNGGYIFVSEDFVEDKTNMQIGRLKVNASDATKLENKLIDLKKQDTRYSELSISNYEEYANQEKKIILLVSIFLYGFIAVITLIGVTNIFNTITTNMILRSKEFANLKSIGMTTKEFNKMIRLESILYGLKSLIIGIPIGLLGSFAIFKAFANSIDFGYIMPWNAILISIIFVFIIVGFTMKYSLNKINKQNIIDTIRQDNI